MEGKYSKMNRMMITSVVLAMVLGAQAQQDMAPQEFSWDCSKKCLGSCISNIIFPVKFSLCFGLCMVTCKGNATPTLYNCTSKCATSIVINVSPGTISLIISIFFVN